MWVSAQRRDITMFRVALIRHARHSITSSTCYPTESPGLRATPAMALLARALPPPPITLFCTPGVDLFLLEDEQEEVAGDLRTVRGVALSGVDVLVRLPLPREGALSARHAPS